MSVRSRLYRLVLVLSCLAVALACAGPGTSESVHPATGAMADVATNLTTPWGGTFLPDGTALVTERTGAIKSIKGGVVTTAATIPGVLENGAGGAESGLLGIAASPNYATDKLVFVYYTTASDNRIAKLQLGGQPTAIVTGIVKNTYHNGGGLAFGPDGYLYASTGDAGVSSRAQDLNSLNGKTLRMTADGKPAPGNPFANSLVYTYGHRNVQGFAWDAQSRLFASELGNNSLDELNRIESGKNYGWPTCEGPCSNPQYVNPLLTWPTSQASPSGLAIVGSTIYMACLRGQKVFRIPINADGGVGNPTSILTGNGRMRYVKAAPDGTLWAGTSNRDGRGTPQASDDRIISVTP
ncbi:PQQ-dependent sugar dehydrogenase [Pseudonocardiaceae bacterium YIM PH 21723]|nr:PQQ-dependent sugar dehydrogenase [Pseudonocardiaceae bacterium YIM PH 21723]